MNTYEAFIILEIDTTKPFDLKKAWKTVSLKSHPDKGGSVTYQQRVNHAYEFLKCQGYIKKTKDDISSGIDIIRDKWMEKINKELEAELKTYDDYNTFQLFRHI